jgi:hypothetical protein
MSDESTKYYPVLVNSNWLGGDGRSSPQPPFRRPLEPPTLWDCMGPARISARVQSCRPGRKAGPQPRLAPPAAGLGVKRRRNLEEVAAPGESISALSQRMLR